MRQSPPLLPFALLLVLLVPASPAVADPAGTTEACSPYLAFIDPAPPVVCVEVTGVDACASVDGAARCVRHPGPVLG